MAITRKISGGLGTPVWVLGERVRSAFPKVNFPGHQSLCLGSLLSHRHWEQAGAPTSQGRRHHRWRGNRGWFDNGNGCGLGDRNFLSLSHRPEGCQGQSRTNHDGGCARWEKSTSWSQRPHVLHHHPAGGGQVNPGVSSKAAARSFAACIEGEAGPRTQPRLPSIAATTGLTAVSGIVGNPNNSR